MFNQDFYPTPDHVIASMLSTINALHGKTVLEPSAGSGAILDYISTHYPDAKLLACEKDPRLKHIASAKSHKFLADDFLSVQRQDVSHVSTIVMNPPFSAGAKHLAHAWEILPDGGQIVCLLNEGTLRNAMGESARMMRQAVDKYGYITYLGECFSDAERKTDVNVDMITLNKPGSPDDDFSGFFMDDEPEHGTGGAGIMRHDEIREVVNRYVGAVRIFREHEVLSKKMNALTSPFGVSGFSFQIEYNQHVSKEEDFISGLQKKAWKYIFSKLQLEKFLTTRVMERINKFAENQQKVPFTMRNIYHMLDIIIGTSQENLNKALVEAVDNFTCYTHENRYGVEGWKTNEGHLLAKKFIVSYAVTMEYGHMSVHYNSRTVEYFDDLVKVLCKLTSTGYDHVGTLREPLTRHCYIWLVKDGRKAGTHDFDKDCHITPWGNSKDDYCIKEACRKLDQSGIEYEIRTNTVERGQWFDFAFFRIKGYKKGSMHVEFLDRKVWETLNRKYAQIKGQVLPEKL
jgi:hypothetical protein